MSLSLSAVLVATVLSAAPASPSSARRVAVLDFNASWAATCSAANPSDSQRERCEMLRLFADKARLGALAVLRPPAFVVMTRENTAQILKDMGGQCTEGECEVETARLLGAAIVVSGEVTFMEGTWIVSLKVHDVTSAALLGGADTQAKSKLEAFGNVRAETEKMLRASVGLEAGSPVAAAAPPPKPPAVEPSKPPDLPKPPEPPRPPAPGTLVLEVSEDEAQVTLDGQPLGAGPIDEVFEVKAGAHKLAVTKPGFIPYEETLTVEPGKRLKSKPRLVRVPKKVDPVGVLVLNVPDEDALVLLDGKKLGTGPLEKELTIPEGTHQLVVMKQGFFTLTETVKIEIGGKTKAKPRLVAVPVPEPAAAAGAPEPDRRDRLWSVELRIVPYGRTGEIQIDPKLSDGYMTFMGGGVEVGRRFHRDWKVLSALDLVFGGQHSAGGSDQLGLNFKANLLLAAGVAWMPAGSPRFSLGARVGVSQTEIALEVGGVSHRRTTNGFGAVLDARLDVPVSNSWYLGARAGVAFVPLVGSAMSVPFAGSTVKLEGSFMGMMQLSVAVGYRL